LDIFKKQNSEMLLQLHSLSQQLSESQLENQVLQTRMDKLLCREGALSKSSLEELEVLEKELKRSLDIVEAKKVFYVELYYIISHCCWIDDSYFTNYPQY
jgi:hypothetical protein